MTPMLTGIVTDIAFIIVVCQKRLLWFCFQKHNIMSLATAGCAQENLKVMKLNLYKGEENRNFILI